MASNSLKRSETPPALSIVIAAYNSAATLHECLTAITKSSFLNFEILVVDDGSEDNTSAIARKFTPNVYRLETNRGRNVARTLGYSKARAPFIVNIDSDILVQTDTLQNLVNLIREHPRTKVWAGYLAKPEPKLGIAEFMKELKLHRLHSSCIVNAGSLYGGFFAFHSSFTRHLKSTATYADDTEMGMVFVELGCNIHFRKELEVMHLKRYTIVSLFFDELQMAFDWSLIFFRRRLWNPSDRTGALFRHFCRHLFSINVCRIFVKERGMYGLLLCTILYLVTVPAILLGTFSGVLHECIRQIPVASFRNDSPAL